MKLPFNKLALTVGALSTSLIISNSFAFELNHSNGTVNLDNTPQRIVSYDLAQLDTLNALGIDVVGVPKSKYSGALEKFNDYTVIGTLFEPDYDILKKQNPDLIIAGGRSAAAMPELSKIATTVSFNLDTSNFIESVKTSVLEIGKAWNKQDQAQAAFTNLEQQIKQLQHINQGKTGAMLFVINDNVMAHAPGDRFGFVFEWTGLTSVLPARKPTELGKPRPKAGSPEAKAAAEKRVADVNKIAKSNPDWIIVLDRGAINDGEKTAAATLAKHPALSQTKAFKNQQIYYADPNSLYVVTGGVNNLAKQTTEMIGIMQEK